MDNKKRRQTKAFRMDERASPPDIKPINSDAGEDDTESAPEEEVQAVKGHTLPPPPFGICNQTRPRAESGDIARISVADNLHDPAAVKNIVAQLSASFPEEAEMIARSFGVIEDIAEGRQAELLMPTELPPPPDGCISDDKLTSGSVHVSEFYLERAGGKDEVPDNVPRVVLVTMLGMFQVPVVGRIKIGRALDNDVAVEGNPYVSKHHVVIEAVKDRVMIADLKSKNGTLINGERLVGLRELKDGDQVSLGDESRGAKIFFVDPRTDEDKKEQEPAAVDAAPEKGKEMTDNDNISKAPPPPRPSAVERELAQRASEIPPPEAADGKLTEEVRLPDLDEIAPIDSVDEEGVPAVLSELPGSEAKPAQSEPEPTQSATPDDSWSFGSEAPESAVEGEVEANGDEDTMPSIPPDAPAEPEPASDGAAEPAKSEFEAVVPTAETQLISQTDLPVPAEPEKTERVEPPPLPPTPGGRRPETAEFPPKPMPVPKVDPRARAAAAPTKAIPPTTGGDKKDGGKKDPPPPPSGSQGLQTRHTAAILGLIALVIVAVIFYGLSRQNKALDEGAVVAAVETNDPAPSEAEPVKSESVPMLARIVDDTKPAPSEPAPASPAVEAETPEDTEVAAETASEMVISEEEVESFNPLDEETQVELSRGFRPIDPNSPIAAFIRGEASPRKVGDCMPIGVTLQELDVIRCIEFLPTARDRNKGVFEISKWVLKTQGALD